MRIKANRHVIVAVMSLVVLSAHAAEPTAAEPPRQEPAGIMDLFRDLQSNQSTNTKTAEPRPNTRLLHFPKDRCIGFLCAADVPPVEDYWQWIQQYSSQAAGIEYVGKAMGDVTVPADKMVRLDVDGKAWESGSILTELRPDDIQMLSFARCDVDDSALKDIGRLTGLEAICLFSPARRTSGRLRGPGLKYLADLPKLKYLFLPGYVSTEGLESLQVCPSLRLLYFGGVVPFPDDRLRAVGKMTRLTHLNLGDTAVGPGLAYLKDLRGLKYLNLAMNRNPQIGAHLANIADLTELEELYLGGQTTTDQALRHLTKMTKLKRLNLSFCNITGAGLMHLKDLTQLQNLELENTQIGDSALVHVGRFSNLQNLSLVFNPVTYKISDAGLVHLAGLGSLRKLNFEGIDVTDQSTAFLANMPHLEDLNIVGGKLTDAAMPTVTKCTALKRLGLSNCSITDQGFAQLAQLKLLESLTISNTRITGDGIAVFQKLPRLSELSLWNVKLGPSGLAHLAGCRSLRRLYFGRLDVGLRDQDFAHLAGLTSLQSLQANGNSSITNEALASLSALTALESLYITGNANITDDGLKHLAHLTSLREVHLSHAPVTAAGLRHLQHLKSLQSLVLDDSRVTKADAAQIERAIPGLNCLVRNPSARRQTDTRKPLNRLAK